MKKTTVLVMGACALLALSSCKSSESAYKKAYEKAKQQELAQPAVTEEAPATTAPVAAPVEAPKVVEASNVGVRQEKVEVVSGNGLLDYSVVCGSFGVKANAENLKNYLINQGYAGATVVFNAEAAMYRVVVSTFADRASAAAARDDFKAKYPARNDFQGSWLLYRLK